VKNAGLVLSFWRDVGQLCPATATTRRCRCHPPPPPTAGSVPFDQAVLNAGKRRCSQPPPRRPVDQRTVVIDPLVNGVTANNLPARRCLPRSLTELAQQKYPQFNVQPVTASTVADAPLVMVGTFTGQRAEPADGMREGVSFPAGDS